MKNIIALVFALAVAPAAKSENLVMFDISDEIECLSLNIYHEARGSSFADQVAVADVTINRVYHPDYPRSVCGVVKQAKLSEWHLSQGRKVPIKNKCQFSWYCDGKSDTPTDSDSWANAVYIATNMLENNSFRGITEGATHYHAHYVEPKWAKSFQFVSRIGSHFYYRTTD